MTRRCRTPISSRHHQRCFQNSRLCLADTRRTSRSAPPPAMGCLRTASRSGGACEFPRSLAPRRGGSLPIRGPDRRAGDRRDDDPIACCPARRAPRRASLSGSRPWRITRGLEAERKEETMVFRSISIVFPEMSVAINSF